MSNNNELSWDSSNFLQDVLFNKNITSNSAKIESLIGEVSEMKSMLSNILAILQGGRSFSARSVSLGSGSNSSSNNRRFVEPVSFDILDDQDKLEEINSNARSNRGNRRYGKDAMKRITGAKSERLLIIAMCILWLEETNVQYGMSTVDEETAAREQDANDTYNNTNALIILFCCTKYAGKGLDFLWSGLSADEQVTTSFVVERIVLETLTIEACLPLSLVLDSWVTFHLPSVAIRNDGKRKKNKRPVLS
ncbi:hypothetical protein INT48_009638 [Thamnidium elegans]|uniref:Uncharacterized protein n=1 Tax=Thamnidium elegans TaxID=101142 RepID=A0A8H7SWK2_9FUNG|nr:hypothetical protein INT48_009638 [Thamnidium elegans]